MEQEHNVHEAAPVARRPRWLLVGVILNTIGSVLLVPVLYVLFIGTVMSASMLMHASPVGTVAYYSLVYLPLVFLLVGPLSVLGSWVCYALRRYRVAHIALGLSGGYVLLLLLALAVFFVVFQ